MGVSDANLVPTIAEALNQLDRSQAIVLYGRENLDEAGLADITNLAVLANGRVRAQTLNPEELGLSPAPTSALRGGDIAENVSILRNVLQGKGTQAQQDVIALNAALALKVGGVIAEADDADPNQTYRKGIALAKEILASGAAWDKLKQLVEFLH
jgi:anthranilate phosphoribosyltransferase